VYTLRDFRERYREYSDGELRSLLADGQESLMPDAWLALNEEIARRQLSAVSEREAEPVGEPIRVRRHYAKASLSARVAARFIDSAIAWGPASVAFTIHDVWVRAGLSQTLGIVLFLGLLVWALFYEFVKDGRTGGQSFGKQAVGLMVVNPITNEPCAVGESCIRTLVMAMLNFIPFIGVFIEPLVALLSTDGRRLGDRAAGTQVVDVGAYDASSW
jgi:uncharacterized RDD family membrane protein YckC